MRLPWRVPPFPSASADVAQGRWGKLVSARSHCTPRLKLYQFQSLAALCTSFAALLEPHSARAAAAVRLVALAQCRAYVEALHARSVGQVRVHLRVYTLLCMRACACICC